MVNLSSIVKITKCADYASAATSDVTGSTIDMAGYDGVLFITSYGTAAANNDVHVESGAASNMSDAADLTGTNVASGTSDEDVWVDVYRPQERYVRLIAERGTSSTLDGIWAIQYGPRSMPVDNTTSGTITGEQHASPAEGTA